VRINVTMGCVRETTAAVLHTPSGSAKLVTQNAKRVRRII